MRTFCSTVEGGGGRKIGCLYDHREKLDNQQCRVMVEEIIKLETGYAKAAHETLAQWLKEQWTSKGLYEKSHVDAPLARKPTPMSPPPPKANGASTANAQPKQPPSPQQN